MDPLDKATVFRANLDKAIQAKGWTRIQASEKAGVPYDWLRRVLSKGLSRPTTTSTKHLEALVRALEMPSVEALWAADPTGDDALVELFRQWVIEGKGSIAVRTMTGYLLDPETRAIGAALIEYVWCDYIRSYLVHRMGEQKTRIAQAAEIDVPIVEFIKCLRANRGIISLPLDQQIYAFTHHLYVPLLTATTGGTLEELVADVQEPEPVVDDPQGFGFGGFEDVLRPAAPEDQSS